MKRFIKNNIKVFFAILITTIIIGSVSVYATSQYFATQIGFTPSPENQGKGFTATNVEEALNQLYDKSARDPITDGFVALFDESFHDASSAEREINIDSFNSQYATKNDNTLTITAPGTYTAYYTVGHSPVSNSYRTDGKLYLNNEAVEKAEQSYIYTSATLSKQFIVTKDAPIDVKYTIVTQVNIASGRVTTFGSVVIVKNS